MASRERRPRDILTRFNSAVSVIQSLPKDGPFQPSNMMKLKFYALYKQATIGPCNVSKPSFWDVTGRAKWEAWNMVGNASKEEAMLNYIEELQKIVETMPQSKEVEEFLNSIGPFYEEANEATAEDDDGKEATSKRMSVASHDNSSLLAPVEQMPMEGEDKQELVEGSLDMKSNSEEDIFSDPITTPESSESPNISPYLQLKTPPIPGSPSEGEFDFNNNEYVVVSSEASATSPARKVSSSSDKTDNFEDTFNELPISDSLTIHSVTLVADDHSAETEGRQQQIGAQHRNTTVVSGQLNQVRQELHAILHRLNSLEVILDRRRAAQMPNWWWPFPELSMSTALVIVLWPILVNFLLRKFVLYRIQSHGRIQ